MLDQVALKTLVDEVASNTSGTVGDPITRADCEVVVTETIKQLRDNPEVRSTLLANGVAPRPEDEE